MGEIWLTNHPFVVHEKTHFIILIQKDAGTKVDYADCGRPKF